jgi:hypothetical protein
MSSCLCHLSFGHRFLHVLLLYPPQQGFLPASDLQKYFNVKFESADGVFEVVILQHSRVQDAKCANDVVLAVKRNVNRGRMAGEISRV